ncbi:hypothetical protein [Mesorhizobium sp. B2-4-15]|uniref:hypothetical protein n=1 Tax=Mesorhizobium sp. B2-4-15 TaxID=2589934 RepID=UPI0015EF3957|nr:hypothetical protein [Mesorhizobium sp. B2-4-15]
MLAVFVQDGQFKLPVKRSALDRFPHYFHMIRARTKRRLDLNHFCEPPHHCLDATGAADAKPVTAGTPLSASSSPGSQAFTARQSDSVAEAAFVDRTSPPGGRPRREDVGHEPTDGQPFQRRRRG